MKPYLAGRERYIPTAAALAAAAAFGGIVRPAAAEVVYSSMVNVAIPATSSGLYLRMDPSDVSTTPLAGYDVNFWGAAGEGLSFDLNGPGGGVVTISGGTAVLNLLGGEMIDASRFYSPSTGNSAANFSSTGYGIVGFKFTREADSTVHYGWARFKAASAAASGVLLDYAWEAIPDTGILAGATTSDPSAGACCMGNGTCSITDATSCISGGGTFGGSGSVCAGFCGVTSISENFDSVASGGLPAGWYSWSNSSTGLPWAAVNNFAHSGSGSVFTNDVGTVSTQILSMPVIIAAGPVNMEFWSRYSVDAAHDGWVVEASINGGPFTNIGQSAWRGEDGRLNDYNASISIPFLSPIAGQRAFAGTAYLEWDRRTASIPASSGDYVALRFKMASDDQLGGTGVWIDDVQVTSAATGACCLPDGTCQMLSVPACTGAGGVFNSAVSCATAICTRAPYHEVEPNETKDVATPINFANPGDYIQGNTTGSSTTPGDAASADMFLVTTPALPPNIYRHRLTIMTSGTEGHIGYIHGVRQGAGGLQGPWPGPVGYSTGMDTTVQTSTAFNSSPPRMNQWYGFGKREQIYYQVIGTSSTTADYMSQWSYDVVTPTTLGTFATGPITITTVGQGHNTNTALWVYDSNFNAIEGYGNDGSSTNGGAPSTSQIPSWLTRTYAPGTYYLALSTSHLNNNKGTPCDDSIAFSASLLDFPNAIVSSSFDAAVNVAFAVKDAAGTTQFPATRPAGAFEVMWYKFTVATPPACYANCDNSTVPPVLNVIDFTCFLQKFAAGDPYANCDHSTTPPVLNVIDFTCFLQKFAAGCP
jgi:hypothetical protein